LILLFINSLQFVNGQDTIKKTIVKKPAVVKSATTVVMPANSKPAAIDPKTGKPITPPINPKTGKPYTKYGYGAYAANKYDASKTTRKADSLKKTATPAAVPPATDTATPAPTPTDNSLNGQYQSFLSKIYNYQRPFAAALWKSVADTLNANKRKLADAQAKTATQSKTISDLQANNATGDTTSSADDIDVFGITFSKGVYNLLMWGLVIILGVTTVVVIAKTGSYKHEATYRTGLYSELEEEFKTYKTKANDKEKKLARELQTERNKVDELMGRG